MAKALKPSPTNQDLARGAAQGGHLLRGNNALEVYAAFIVFFHHAVRWSYDDLVEHLNVALAPWLGAEKVTRRKIETILTKHRKGLLLVTEQEIERIAASDPIFVPYLERWRQCEASNTAPSSAAPASTVARRRSITLKPQTPKSKPVRAPNSPKGAKIDAEASSHHEKMLKKGQDQAKIAETFRKMLRPDEGP